jgi:hypothetical protein
MAKLLLACLCACLISVIGACASTTYKEYVGGRIVTAEGGTRETVEGIEVWENGAPNRPFRVIGIVDDKRSGGLIPRSMRLSDIAKKAKEGGGDAVVIYQEGSKLAGFISESYSSISTPGSISTSSLTVPRTRLETKAAVIKFEPKTPEPAASDSK